MPSLSRLGRTALAYADQFGWACFPLAPRGKLPLISKEQGGRGCIDASTDLALIEGWWQGCPEANVGIAGGAASGIWLLDIDTDKGGAASLEELEKIHGALPDTPTVTTGSGGRHFYFAIPAGEHTIRNRSKIWPGIDTRCDHGYVVAPPSVHPNGNAYTWVRSPKAVAIAQAPEWLVRGVSDKPARSVAPRPATTLPQDRILDRARSYLARMPASVSGEGGHQKLWAAAITLVVGFDLQPHLALDLLASDFNPRCSPEWSQKELEHKVSDATGARLSRGYMLESDGRPAPPTIDPGSFFLGSLFKSYGWIGTELRPGAWAVRCPAESLHGAGNRFDGQSLLLAPNRPGRPGFFLCSHASCNSIFTSLDVVANAMQRVATAEGL